MTETLGPNESPGLLLWRATLRWERLLAGVLKPLELTHVQFVLLASTWWLTIVAAEHPNQRRLAEHAGTDLTMTSQVLRTLQSRGLITRTTDPNDSRAIQVGVTHRGASLAKRAISLVETADTEFFSSAADQTLVLEVLQELANPPATPDLQRA